MQFELEYQKTSAMFILWDTEKQTLELCLETMRRDGYGLLYVARKFKTREICLEAIKQNRNAIDFVPKEYQDIHRAWKIMYG